MRRSADRFTTVAPARPDAAAGWAVTRHSFSFGEHYDPDNVGFGPLVALNDETVRAGEGYPEHTHRDVEIVSWVLSGTLVHVDTTGAEHEVPPGSVQRLSAGSGVRHTEGAGPAGPVRFVQTWVRPDRAGHPPAYAATTFDPADLARGWVLVASGSDPAAAVALGTGGATLWVARLPPGESRRLPGAASAYAFLARGRLHVEPGETLDEGDALAVTGATPLSLTALEPAELLVWTFDR